MRRSKFSGIKENTTVKTARMYFVAGRTFSSVFIFLSMVSFLVLFTGCGGSDSGSSGTPVETNSREVSALSLPDRVSLTDEDSATTSAGLRGAFAYNDAGTDYSNLPKQTWVEDGTDALTMVNDILSIMDQTNYPDYVNYGPYKALVKPIEETGQSQGGATSTSTETVEYQEMTLEVTRASETAPMYVNIWLQEPKGPGDMPMLIRGRFIVTREAGDGYPYGELEAHFKGNKLEADGSVGSETFQMAISIGVDADGKVAIEYVEDMAEGEMFEERRRARVLASSDLSEGNAYIYNYRKENFGKGLNEQEETSLVAFDENYFKIQVVGGDTLVYDKNELSHRIFRYKLFREDTGAAVTRSSGFPIQLADGGHAYVGYHGLWAPYGVEINDGDTVTRADTGATYTVVKKRGILKKHTAATITLAELEDVEISYWNNGTDAIIVWDGSTFNIIGTRNHETGQIEYAAGAAVTFEEWGGGWCESMRAFLPLGRLYKDGEGNAATPTGASVIKYHKEQTINPGDVSDLTLYFGNFALDLPITNAVLAGAQDAQMAFWQQQDREIQTYFFDASELVLKEASASGEEVLFSEGLTIPENSNYSWGYHIMPLVTNSSFTAETWWQAHDEDTFYSWQTGNNQWQHFTTLKDANGNYVVFDPPLVMTYTHSNANDVNWSSGEADVPSSGKKFNIEYNGFELHIPWAFNENVGDWTPMFNIADGTVVTSAGTDYVIKAAEEALIMESLDNPPAAANALAITEIDPPTIAYDSTVTDLIGDPSTVADAEIPTGTGSVQLLVIGGTTVQ
ncbi:MAG: hypothetical protein C0403_03820 [Desulfobacterium sp.]|nr:hypothetical protein [Desulfobacterium sp.]